MRICVVTPRFIVTVVEAMMCGCTPVATDRPTGRRELLDRGRFGYLVRVRDPLALANGIEDTLDRQFRKRCPWKGGRPFAMQGIVDQHFTLLGLARTSAKGQPA